MTLPPWDNQSQVIKCNFNIRLCGDQNLFLCGHSIDRLTSSEGSGWLPLCSRAGQLEQVLRMPTERSPMRRFLPLVLAALFCTITVSQLTTPLSALALGSTPRLATHCRRFTRYTVEEVDNKPIDIATTSGYLTFSLSDVELKRDLAATNLPDEAALTEWPYKFLFHRRTPPRSSDDNN